MSEYNGFEVTESGIVKHVPKYGADVCEVILPKEVFIEAYYKYIDKAPMKKIKEQKND